MPHEHPHHTSFTSSAHAQTNIASRTSTNIVRHMNIPYETPLHRFCSRTNKTCLANHNQHHIPHERPQANLSAPLLLRHKQTSPVEPQATSHATRTFLTKLLFTSCAQAQTNTASRTSSNMTCHTNIPKQTSPHLFRSHTKKYCLANLNQHHMPHECLLHVFPKRCAFNHEVGSSVREKGRRSVYEDCEGRCCDESVHGCCWYMSE